MADTRRHLEAIGRQPRFAGSAAEAEAREWCRLELERSGFSVTEEPFAYSEAIGRWAVPAIAGAMGLALGLAGLAWRAGDAGGWVTWLVAGFGLALGAVGWWASRHGVLAFPWFRRDGVNLVATRGSPSLWLVAHLDSKSQPVPTLVRAALLLVLGASAVATLIIGVTGRAADGWVVPLAGAVSGICLSFVTVGNESAGARDNASGVAAVLAAASALPAPVALGIVVTSAEELGLAGARAWVRGRAGGTAINVDTLDDHGSFLCMRHGGASAALASHVADVAADGVGAQVRVRGLLSGLLTDGVALADAGWRVVTLSRGTWRTLGRIHRPGDTVRDLTGAGADLGARLLVDLVTRHT